MPSELRRRHGRQDRRPGAAASFWRSEEGLATEPKLLPRPFALGTEVVGVAEDPALALRLVLAPRARHPRIAPNRHQIAEDDDREHPGCVQLCHGASPPSVASEKGLIPAKGRQQVPAL